MKKINNRKVGIAVVIIILSLLILGSFKVWRVLFSKPKSNRDMVILSPAPSYLLSVGDRIKQSFSKGNTFSYNFADDGALHINLDGKEYVVLPDGTILQVDENGNRVILRDDEIKSKLLKLINDEINTPNVELENYFDNKKIEKQIDLLALDKSELRKIADSFDIEQEELENIVNKLKTLSSDTLVNMSEEDVKKLAEDLGIPYEVLKTYIDNIKQGKEEFTLDDLKKIVDKKNETQKEIYDEVKEILKSLGYTDDVNEVLKKINDNYQNFSDFVDDVIKDGAKKTLLKLGIGEEEKELDFADILLKNNDNNSPLNDPFAEALKTWAEKDTSLNNSVVSSLSGDNTYKNVNSQNEKRSFLNDRRQGTTVISRNKKNNMILKGTIIKATLRNSINTDLPGELYAIVSENVYDSFNLKNIIIPKGSVLCGEYDSSVSWGQNSVLISWTELRRPDGVIIRLNGYSSTNKMGESGSSSSVDNHIGTIIGGTVLSSLIKYTSSALSSATQVEVLSEALTSGGSAISNVANKFLDKAINRQPTLKISAGTKITALANDNIELPLFTGY